MLLCCMRVVDVVDVIVVGVDVVYVVVVGCGGVFVAFLVVFCHCR